MSSMMKNSTLPGELPNNNSTKFVKGHGYEHGVAIITTIVFALIELLTNGGLLILLLALWKKVGRYVSFVQNWVLLSIVIKALLDLTMRLPLFMMGSKTVRPGVCIALSLIPDYAMLAILVTLPLISAERLVKLSVPPTYSRKKIRHAFMAIIGFICIIACVVSLLPATSIFVEKRDGEVVNTKCSGYLNYGFSFAYLYTGLTALSVLLVISFSVSTVILLRSKLRDVETTETKKSVLKRGVISALTMTLVLFIATVPFALVLQLVMMCDATEDCIDRFSVAFRSCVILQKLSFSTLPIFFLLLNKPLRRKVKQYIKVPWNTDISRAHAQISTSTEKLSSDFTASPDHITMDHRSTRPPTDMPPTDTSPSSVVDTSRV